MGNDHACNKEINNGNDYSNPCNNSNNNKYNK